MRTPGPYSCTYSFSVATDAHATHIIRSHQYAYIVRYMSWYIRNLSQEYLPRRTTTTTPSIGAHAVMPPLLRNAEVQR